MLLNLLLIIRGLFLIKDLMVEIHEKYILLITSKS